MSCGPVQRLRLKIVNRLPYVRHKTLDKNKGYRMQAGPTFLIEQCNRPVTNTFLLLHLFFYSSDIFYFA